MNTPTSNFRRQHDELVELAVELSAVIESERAPDSVARIQSILNRLAGKLKIHKAMEEESLYSDLLVHERPDVRELAQRFQREFGDVYAFFLDFRAHWDAPRVDQEYAEFVRAGRGVIAALADRVARENGELYDAVDELYRAPVPVRPSNSESQPAAGAAARR
jgi:hypothetical protein